ncbi:hypothetical protein HPB47_022501 [Ixodes persulcatus]|uniref:Uncharacterized protein n=1 Tax=Ixodes persulcatus TaxID=34615 RepID=A0AC60Q9I4_IXOPE|nr:hypothetical protein HPB47_022501 [Ixodes persulcatus]
MLCYAESDSRTSMQSQGRVARWSASHQRQVLHEEIRLEISSQRQGFLGCWPQGPEQNQISGPTQGSQ